jgi:glycosyltransferase involved in cell wall biosynthesis
MGGTERMSINIASVMAQKGFESHLIVSRRSGGMTSHVPDGVHLHFLNKKAFYDLNAFYILFRLRRKYNPTVLHAHSTSIFWAILLKIVSDNFLLVWHDHFGLSDHLEKYPRKEMVVLSKWIDRIVCVNAKLTSYWKELLPDMEKNIVTINNFPFLILKDQIKSQTFTFLHLANFRLQKNHLNLVNAVKILSKIRSDFRLIMVGELVEHGVKERVSEEINKLELNHLITINGPSEDISFFLNCCHSGILSSDSEGLPVSLLEYGLAGFPVVCTDVGDCGKVISSPDFGYLIPPNDPLALANAMNETLSNPENSLIIGENLRKKIQNEYGSNFFFNDYMRFVYKKN